jgi:formyltetrahydrofolate-dependent phosphoribosylglycinamide formyltransferase
MSLKIAILVSGRGSNMTAILDAIDAGELDAKVALVFSNNTDAPALATAAARGIPTASLSHRGIPREHHEQQVLKILSEYDFDFIVLAGYMRVLSPNFLRSFKDERGFFKVINIHPSLLPAFPGTHGYEEAFEYGVRLSGITVHLVDEQVDHGPILAQESFPRLPEDDLEAFKSRGLALEHKLFPKVLQDIASHGINLLKSKNEQNPSTEAVLVHSQTSKEKNAVPSGQGPKGGPTR